MHAMPMNDSTVIKADDHWPSYWFNSNRQRAISELCNLSVQDFHRTEFIGDTYIAVKESHNSFVKDRLQTTLKEFKSTGQCRVFFAPYAAYNRQNGIASLAVEVGDLFCYTTYFGSCIVRPLTMGKMTRFIFIGKTSIYDGYWSSIASGLPGR